MLMHHGPSGSQSQLQALLPQATLVAPMVATTEEMEVTMVAGMAMVAATAVATVVATMGVGMAMAITEMAVVVVAIMATMATTMVAGTATATAAMVVTMEATPVATPTLGMAGTQVPTTTREVGDLEAGVVKELVVVPLAPTVKSSSGILQHRRTSSLLRHRNILKALMVPGELPRTKAGRTGAAGAMVVAAAVAAVAADLALLLPPLGPVTAPLPVILLVTVLQLLPLPPLQEQLVLHQSLTVRRAVLRAAIAHYHSHL